MNLSDADLQLIESWRSDWNRFIRDVLGLRLDREQRKIVDSVQNNRRTTVRSGHARGKDFAAAAISLTFLYIYIPSKVINTAPTQRQATSIMMAEIGKIHRNAKIPLGGELLQNQIKFYDRKTHLTEWFLLAFKAGDKESEAWTGFHSQNILVVVTEASGLEQETFDAIDGLLTGTMSRLLIVFNPNRTIGEAYQSTRSPLYAKHRLNCLNAPNVRAKKILIPGQVDYEWVREKLDRPGWATRIDEAEADKIEFHDFKFEGQWYRPSDLFLVKVLGEFPRESDDTLYPLSWIEAAIERWHEKGGKGEGLLKIGADIAGLGADQTVFARRRGTVVEELKKYQKADHMETAGRLKIMIKADDGDVACIDTIGEGAGVYSRLVELEEPVFSCKFSQSAEGLSDFTGMREFLNMRAYCFWALRDALDPKLGGSLALPPDDELVQELCSIKWQVMSNGKIKIEAKDDIKKRLGRSPDEADAVALSFWPNTSGEWSDLSASAER